MAIAARARIGKHAYRVPPTGLQAIKFFQQWSRNSPPQACYLPSRSTAAFVLSDLAHQHLKLNHVCQRPIHRESNVAHALASG